MNAVAQARQFDSSCHMIRMTDFRQRLPALRSSRQSNHSRRAECLGSSLRVDTRRESGDATAPFGTVLETAGTFYEPAARRHVAGADPRIKNPERNRLYQKAGLLTCENQWALPGVLDSLWKRSRMGIVMAG